MRLFWGCLAFSLLVHLLFFPGFLSALMKGTAPEAPPPVSRERVKVRLVERKAVAPRAKPSPRPAPRQTPRPSPPPLARHDHPLQTRPSLRPPVESSARTEAPPRTETAPELPAPRPEPPRIPRAPRYPTAQAPSPPGQTTAASKPAAPAPPPRLTRTPTPQGGASGVRVPVAESAAGPAPTPGTVPVQTAVASQAPSYRGAGTAVAGPTGDADAAQGVQVMEEGRAEGAPGAARGPAAEPAPTPQPSPPPAPAAAPPPPVEPPTRVAAAPPRMRDAEVEVPVLKLPARLRRESFRGNLSLRAVIETDGSAAFHLSDSSGNSDVDRYILEQIRQVAVVTVALDESGQPKRAVKRVRVLVEVD